MKPCRIAPHFAAVCVLLATPAFATTPALTVTATGPHRRIDSSRQSKKLMLTNRMIEAQSSRLRHAVQSTLSHTFRGKSPRALAYDGRFFMATLRSVY